MRALRTLLPFPLVVLIAALGGCVAEPVGDDDDDATGPEAVTYCADPTPATDLGNAWGVESARYSLYVEGTEAQATDFGALLEAAYDAYADWWAADLEPDEALRVEFYATEGAMLAAIAADGVPKPEHAGGYYHSSSRTAYLYDQPTRYYDQVLLLHEAGHQLHDAFRGLGGQPDWYGEGVVEYLSRHDWDGRCVRLGQLPNLSQEDTPAAARDAWAGLTVEDVLGGAGGRPAWYALLRFLDAEHRDALHAGLARVDGGEPGGLADELSDLGALDSALRAFLDDDQEPLRPTFLEWLHRTPDSVLGWADGVLTIARAKDGDRLDAWFAEPDDDAWAGGVLAGWSGPDDWLAVLVDADGQIWTFDVAGGGATWWDQGPAPAAVDGGWSVELRPADGGSTVAFNGESALYAHGLTPASGLAVNDAEVLFTELSLAP